MKKAGGRPRDRLGLRLYPQRELLFRDVWAPEEDRLGEEGKVRSPQRVNAKRGRRWDGMNVLGLVAAGNFLEILPSASDNEVRREAKDTLCRETAVLT